MSVLGSNETVGVPPKKKMKGFPLFIYVIVNCLCMDPLCYNL